MAFKRVIEDFTCSHCNAEVKGTGYTNHCPKCLYSQHVDISPGDRAAHCGGEMQPVRIEGSTGAGYAVRHRCKKCRMESVTRVAENDDPDAILALVNAQVKAYLT